VSAGEEERRAKGYVCPVCASVGVDAIYKSESGLKRHISKHTKLEKAFAYRLAELNEAVGKLRRSVGEGGRPAAAPATAEATTPAEAATAEAVAEDIPEEEVREVKGVVEGIFGRPVSPAELGQFLGGLGRLMAALRGPAGPSPFEEAGRLMFREFTKTFIRERAREEARHRARH